MKRILNLLWIACWVSLSVTASATVFQHDFSQAKKTAQNENKNILMVFAGSDWCRPCIQFKKEILESDAFNTYSESSMVVLYLDFPSQKKNQLPDAQKQHNEALAEQFNKDGAFPKILVFTSDGNKIGDIPFTNQSPADFINQCKALTHASKTESMTSESKSLMLMGCAFKLTVYGADKNTCASAIEQGIAEITRIEQLISSWSNTSQTSKINQSKAGTRVHVDKELYNLIERAKKVSALTQGAFDISFASMDRIWVFDQQEKTLPDSAIVSKACEKINWEKITLHPEDTSVTLEQDGMKIGFGAIGKGYAADMAKQLIANIPGVYGGVINASGDLATWGRNDKGTSWPVQIADPKNQGKSLCSIDVNDMAIVTSGNYEKYFTSNNTRYAHIINPKTGYPVTGLKSVTVISKTAEIADALATSIFVLGKEKGLELANEIEGVECLIVTDDDELFTSNHLVLNYY